MWLGLGVEFDEVNGECVDIASVVEFVEGFVDIACAKVGGMEVGAVIGAPLDGEAAFLGARLFDVFDGFFEGVDLVDATGLMEEEGLSVSGVDGDKGEGDLAVLFAVFKDQVVGGEAKIILDVFLKPRHLNACFLGIGHLCVSSRQVKRDQKGQALRCTFGVEGCQQEEKKAGVGGKERKINRLWNRCGGR